MGSAYILTEYMYMMRKLQGIFFACMRRWYSKLSQMLMRLGGHLHFGIWSCKHIVAEAAGLFQCISNVKHVYVGIVNCRCTGTN